MNDNFDFRDLFVFDLANNHQGSVEHALDIIKKVGTFVRKHQVRGVFKFQFRQLDSFVHPAHQSGSENKHIPRFLSTRLSLADYRVLLEAVRSEGMLAMCTAFDEESVDVIKEMKFDLIKIASCSAQDWPLLESVASSNLPVIFSTGGLQLKHIDDLVSFFDHRGSDFAIMHCVSIYPTPPEDCHLNQIDNLLGRYRNKVIGWSTHEQPSETVPIQIAYAKGARMFERHVGVATDSIALNGYSSTPEQVDSWIEAWSEAVRLCGSTERIVSSLETDSINTLRRGIFARNVIKSGQVIEREDVYFAMPYSEGQIHSGQWKAGIVASSEVSVDSPLLLQDIAVPTNPEYSILKAAIHEVKALLNEARVVLSSEFEVEYSHHYGIPKFNEYGAVIINCINREYCKKLIVQLPGQKHPMHFHPLKEETFQVLYGEMNVTIDGHPRRLFPGDTCLVMPGVWHEFWSENGVIVEEVSTTHFNSDSVYKDEAINKLKRHERKTAVDHWGRFQLTEKIEVAVK